MINVIDLLISLGIKDTIVDKIDDKLPDVLTEKYTEDVCDFIKNNKMHQLPLREIDLIVHTTTKRIKDKLQGEGDKFHAWCIANGRGVPEDDIVQIMNANPPLGQKAIRLNIPNDSALWRSYCSYIAGKGRHNV